MSLTILDWSIIVSFLILSMYVGLKYKNEASGSLVNFFLGGRNLPWYIAGVSMVATTFAADTPLAVTEIVAANGISGNWLWWSFLTGGMLTTFFFANLWRRANILTELELIELRYSGIPAKALRAFKSIYLGVFMNCLVLGWVNLAFNTVLQVFFDIPDNEILFYTGGAMTLAMIYASMSGLLGVAITDTIQFFIAMIGCIILAFIVLNSEDVGGIEGLKNTLPADYFSFFPNVSGNENSNGLSTLTLSIGAFFTFVTVQWWASWYPGQEPGGGGYIAQRMMSTRNEKDAVYATLFFQIAHYCIRPWPWIIVGLCAVALYTPENIMENPTIIAQINATASTSSDIETFYENAPLLEDLSETSPALKKAIEFKMSPKSGFVMAMRDFLPTGLRGLLLAAFLAAYMSTISTQINWGASYLVNDLYKRFLRKEETFDKDTTKQKHYIMISRVMSVLLMVLALCITPFLHSIKEIWEFIMQCGAGLGMVLILRWYWWRINAWTEITATLAPFVWMLVYHLIVKSWIGADLESFESNMGPYLFTVGMTSVSWIIVAFITPHTSMEVLTIFYDRVKPQGNWSIFKQGEKQTIENTTFGLIICWLSAIIMTYATLFFLGKLIFHEWTESGIYFTIAVISFIVLKQYLGKVNILND